MEQPNYLTDDDTLVDFIRRVSSRVTFTGSKQDSAHSQFLLEMIEDMEEQAHSTQYRKPTLFGT